MDIKALFDVTVLMEGLMEPADPLNDSSRLLSLAAERRISGFLCAGSIETLGDLLTRTLGQAQARDQLSRLRTTLDIAPVDGRVLDAAMALGWPNLDDALAHACAELNAIPHLVTLNAADFTGASLPVHLPSEFLQRIVR